MRQEVLHSSDAITEFSLVRRLISRIRLAFAFLAFLGMVTVWFFASYYLRAQEEKQYLGYLEVLSQSLSEPIQYFDLADIDATLNSYTKFLDFKKIQVIDRYNFVQSEFGLILGHDEPDYYQVISAKNGVEVGSLKVWRSPPNKQPIGLSTFLIGGSIQMLIIVLLGSTIMQLILKKEFIDPLTNLAQAIKSDAIDGAFKPANDVLRRLELKQVAFAYDDVTSRAKSLLREREQLLGTLTEENVARKLQVQLFEEALQQSKMTLTYQSRDSIQQTLSLGGWAPPKIRKLISELANQNMGLKNIESNHDIVVRNEIGKEKSGLRSFEAHAANGEIWQIRILKLEGHKIAIFASDETSTKQMENALHQKNKLESLGGVASGVAHDFNNILAIISTALEHIAYDPNETALPVKICTEAVERGTSIVKQLLQFVHVGKTNAATCSLSKIFDNQKDWLEPILHSHIGLEINVVDNLLVDAEPNYLQTLIVNLIINARDAMQGTSGKIWVSSRKLSQQELRENILNADCQYIAIDIKDTGAGISNDVITKIFDPFFSTKPIGQGTGLGLSMAYEYLRRMGGTLYVRETSTKGTTFSIVLRLSVVDAISMHIPTQLTSSSKQD